VAGPIDREAAASYTITVRATSADASFSTQALTIAIYDLDEFDVGPVSDSDVAADAVDENAVLRSLLNSWSRRRWRSSARG
jgi:hypothetical protein